MYQYDKNSYWMPKSIGNYEISERIGRGGMGDIFKATQKSLNRIVALKVLAPHMGRNEEFSRRFQIEAKAISLLQHNNIVSIYEYGEDQGYKYIAMQYVDGCDLASYILSKTHLTIGEVIDFSKQICRGLRYAHSKDIIHRDIKPQNILIDTNNICRITDFGIAKIFAEANITMTGIAVGTPEYMSPEQAEGSALDVQTDIYSLGIVMYEMLTKQPPFSGNNPVAVAYKQVHEIPPSPSVVRRDIPKKLDQLIMKTLKKSKSERYKTIEELLDDLDMVEIPQGDETAKPITRTRKTAAQHSFEQTPSCSIRTQELMALSTQKETGFREIISQQAVSLLLILLLTIAFMLHILNFF